MTKQISPKYAPEVRERAVRLVREPALCARRRPGANEAHRGRRQGRAPAPSGGGGEGDLDGAGPGRDVGEVGGPERRGPPSPRRSGSPGRVDGGRGLAADRGALRSPPDDASRTAPARAAPRGTASPSCSPSWPHPSKSRGLRQTRRGSQGVQRLAQAIGLPGGSPGLGRIANGRYEPHCVEEHSPRNRPSGWSAQD